MLRGSLIALALLAAGGAASAETHRIAVVVGNNRGAPQETPLRYAEAEAQEMMHVLTHLGGVADDWSYLLLGRPAEALRRAFAEVRERIREIGPRGKVLLLVYYSGHADGLGLHLGGSVLPIQELRSFVTNAGAETSVAVIDACHSGTLARAKGVRRGPAYDIRTIASGTPGRMRGHAIITSSGPEELSQENAAVRGSYFSHYVLSGLRGAADVSGDGEVTVSELYQFAYSRTLVRTAHSTVGVQHPYHEVNLVGTGDIILTRPRAARAAILFPPNLPGAYYVVRKRGGKLMAEVEPAGQPVRVALPADTYLVQTHTRDHLLVAQVNLSWGGEHRLDLRDLRAYRLVESAPRGGPAVEPTPHRFDLAFELRTGSVDGEGTVPGLAAHYACHLGRWALGARGFWGSRAFQARDTAIRNHELGVALEFDMALSRGRLEAMVGVAAGIGYVFQAVAGAPDHGSYGGQFEGHGRLAYIVRDPFYLSVDAGIGAILFEEHGAGARARPLLRLASGVGIQF